jgi:glycerophosphoryl diester phosphodiesterase
METIKHRANQREFYTLVRRFGGARRYNPRVNTPSRLAGLAALALVTFLLGSRAPHAQTPKQLIAHRGASGYAPEHTVASYRLAMQQKADFVEPDLAVTKDNVFICLHDDTLERTTNVAEVFGSRPSKAESRQAGPHWLANDFTIEEIKRLDAGKWYKPEFAGARVPTFQEMIDLVRGKAGLYPELKSPQLYKSRNVDQVKLFVDLVKKNGLEKPESLKTTPVIIQSFDEEAIRRVAAELPTIPRVFLTSNDADVTDARLRQLATFATGVAPEKAVIARHPEMVKAAHALRLTVTSWTFRADEKTSFPTVRDEMAHYLYALGIDGLFTNNPDQFPRQRP